MSSFTHQCRLPSFLPCHACLAFCGDLLGAWWLRGSGCVDVVATVYAFAKKQLGTGRTLERGQCSLPPLQYATRAFWMDVGISAKADVERERCDFEASKYPNNRDDDT